MVGDGLLRRCSLSSDLHVKHRQKASDEFGRLGGQFDSVLSVDNDEDAMVTAGTSEARRKAAAIDAMVAICEVGVCVGVMRSRTSHRCWTRTMRTW